LSEAIVNIVGVGSTLMGDDGVGPAAIEALQHRGVPDGVCLHDAGLAVSDVLGGLEPACPLVLIDALRAGSAPGSIYRARLDEMTPEAGSLPQSVSLHEIGAFQALQIEAMSGRRFGDVTLFGVEPQRVAWGEGLSPSIRAAMPKLIDSVLDYVDHQLAATAAGDTSQ